MRRVFNYSKNRVIVERMVKKGPDIWETIANLSPGDMFEGDHDYVGPVRVSTYDDRDNQDRGPLDIVVYEIPESERKTRA